MSFADYLIIFISSFGSVMLLGLQSKNVNNGRYIAAIITSFLLSVTQVLFVYYMKDLNGWAFAFASVGGCMGIATSIWFYDKFMSKKKKTVVEEVIIDIKVNFDEQAAGEDLRKHLAKHGYTELG